MKATIVGDLITEPEREKLFRVGGLGFEGEIAELLSALAEPEMLGHFEDEEIFGHALGLVIGAEAFEEGIEFFLRFRR